MLRRVVFAIFCAISVILHAVPTAAAATKLATSSIPEKCKSICLKFKQMPMLSFTSDCILPKTSFDRQFWNSQSCSKKLLQSCEPIDGLQPIRPQHFSEVRDWNQTCNAAFGSLSREVDADFIFLTVASNPGGLFGRLVASLIQEDIKIVTIGYNFFAESAYSKDILFVQKHKKFFSGFKVVSVYYLLENCHKRGLVSGDAILMFADGTDTIFQGTKESVLRDYLSMNKSLVFSTERDMWPATPLTKVLYAARPEAESRSVFRHLNSGGWIGRVRALLDWYEDWSNPPFVTYKKISRTKESPKATAPSAKVVAKNSVELGKKIYVDQPERSHHRLLLREATSKTTVQSSVRTTSTRKTAPKAKKAKLLLEDPQPSRQIRSAEHLWKYRNEPNPTAEALPLVYTVSDQFNAAHMFLYGVGDTDIDMHAKLFMSTWIPKYDQGDFFELIGSGVKQRLFSKRTQSFPAILHYNGPARDNWCAMDILGIGDEEILDSIFTEVKVANNLAFLDDSLNVIPSTLFSTEFLKALVPRHAVLCKATCLLTDGPMSGYRSKYAKSAKQFVTPEFPHGINHSSASPTDAIS